MISGEESKFEYHITPPRAELPYTWAPKQYAPRVIHIFRYRLHVCEYQLQSGFQIHKEDLATSARDLRNPMSYASNPETPNYRSMKPARASLSSLESQQDFHCRTLGWR